MTGAGWLAEWRCGRLHVRVTAGVAGGLPLRLAWRQWRLRKAPVPQDGARLTDAELRAEAGLLRAWGDKAGTERVAVLEIIAEETTRKPEEAE